MPDTQMILYACLFDASIMWQIAQSQHASPKGYMAFTLSTNIAGFAGIVFLIIYGFRTDLLHPLLLMVIAMPGGLVASMLIGSVIPRPFLSLLAFASWPFSLIMMFVTTFSQPTY